MTSASSAHRATANDTRPRLAIDLPSSAAVFVFVSPGQRCQTSANTLDLASVPPVAGDDPVNGNDPSGDSCSTWQWIAAPVVCGVNKVIWSGSSPNWCAPSNPPYGETFYGNSGCIAYQTSPSGTTAIGIVMAPWTPKNGFFDYVIGIDGRSVDAEYNQYKWPVVHTSIPAVIAPAGSHIEVLAEYVTPAITYKNVPNLFVVPDLSNLTACETQSGKPGPILT